MNKNNIKKPEEMQYHWDFSINKWLDSFGKPADNKFSIGKDGRLCNHAGYWQGVGSNALFNPQISMTIVVATVMCASCGFISVPPAMMLPLPIKQENSPLAKPRKSPLAD